MRPDAMILSAYLDGEVPRRYAAEIEASIRTDDRVRAEYEALVRLRERLSLDPPIDFDKSAAKSWTAIMGRLADRPVDVWHRRVALPIPALAAAALLIVVLAAAFIWSMFFIPASPVESFAGGRDIDVTIRVDGSDMHQVLQWLVDKNMLGEVNIQLPEQRFQIVGEPVFVRPAQFQAEYPR